MYNAAPQPPIEEPQENKTAFQQWHQAMSNNGSLPKYVREEDMDDGGRKSPYRLKDASHNSRMSSKLKAELNGNVNDTEYLDDAIYELHHQLSPRMKSSKFKPPAPSQNRLKVKKKSTLNHATYHQDNIDA